jgi:hypothetical protein
MIASRQKPESARSTISTAGQTRRSCFAMRWISSSAPADASMFEDRSLAHIGCSPVKMYSGR